MIMVSLPERIVLSPADRIVLGANRCPMVDSVAEPVAIMSKILDDVRPFPQFNDDWAELLQAPKRQRGSVRRRPPSDPRNGCGGYQNRPNA